jgi:hypothetical protein
VLQSWSPLPLRGTHCFIDESGDRLVTHPGLSGRSNPRFERSLKLRLLVWDLGQGPPDERPAPRPAFGEALVFQVPIRPMHRVRIDGDLSDHLADGGELVTGPKDAEAKRLTYLIDQLAVRRDP